MPYKDPEKHRIAIRAKNAAWRRRLRAKDPIKQREKEKEYRIKNHEQVLAKNRRADLKRQGKRVAYFAEHRAMNREVVGLKDKERYNKNVEKRRAQARENYRKNAPKRIAQGHRYRVARLRIDRVYAMVSSLRARLWLCLKGHKKAAHTLDLVGCNLQQLREHLQGQFIDGMAWNNYGYGKGKWHVDHIIPCASFDMSQELEQRKCFHWTNLQPLWSHHNMAKGAKLDYVPSAEITK